MTPFVLLILFSTLAICAFVGFIRLTYDGKPDARSEDWKKFLSSFAATALALSVGFISLMLQQQYQAEQRKADEARATQQKLAEEAAQIKTRLFYSVVQKKLDMSILNEIKSNRLVEACDTTKGEDERNDRFGQVKSEMAKFSRYKPAFQNLYASASGYERIPLNKLLRETGFSSRIDDRILSGFVESELALYAQGPNLVYQFMESVTIEKRDAFCERLTALQEELGSDVGMVARIQTNTCVAYALAKLPAEDSLAKSKTAFDEIARFAATSTPRDAAQMAQFRQTLRTIVATGGPDLDICLNVAALEPDSL